MIAAAFEGDSPRYLAPSILLINKGDINGL